MSAGDWIQQLGEIVREPTSNLTAAVLLLAALTLVVLIIIIALLLLVARPPKRRRTTRRIARTADDYEYPELSRELSPHLPGEARRKRPTLTRAWFAGRGGAWLIVLLLALSLAGGYAASSTDGFCRDACHGSDDSMSDRSRAEHKNAPCASCHEDALPGGFFASLVNRTAHLVGQVAPGVEVYAGPVPSRRCLTCHGSVRSAVIETAGGARMSHREPLDAGMACRDCHGQVGHEPVIAVAGMTKCVPCHDSKKASANCRSCHARDTGHASASSGNSRGFPRVQLGPVTDCGGCHDQAPCDACHGLRMPHSIEFLRWKHARSGAFEGKTLCWRCHTKADCSRCHLDFPGHAPGWKDEHKTAAPRARCDCHWHKVPPEAQTPEGFCYLCHS